MTLLQWKCRREHHLLKRMRSLAFQSSITKTPLNHVHIVDVHLQSRFSLIWGLKHPRYITYILRDDLETNKTWTKLHRTATLKTSCSLMLLTCLASPNQMHRKTRLQQLNGIFNSAWANLLGRLTKGLAGSESCLPIYKVFIYPVIKAEGFLELVGHPDTRRAMADSRSEN